MICVRVCACLCVCVLACVRFSGVCVITWGRGGDQRVNVNGKHFLPCLPTLYLTNIIKTVLLFLKYIHIYTCSCVYMFIIINEGHAVGNFTSFLCNLNIHSSAGK